MLDSTKMSIPTTHASSSALRRVRPHPRRCTHAMNPATPPETCTSAISPPTSRLKMMIRVLPASRKTATS